MKLLDAVNLVLPKLGERPVTSLELKHPTLAVLLPIIEQTRIRTLQRGWWFNEYEYTAPLNGDSEIDVGTDVLSFVPHCAGTATVRGSRLYNLQTLTFTFTEPVKGLLRQDVEYDDLPLSAQDYIMNAALVEAFGTDIGISAEIQLWQTLAGRAWSDLLAEHLKQKKHSTRNTRAWGRLMFALRS